MSSLRLLDDAMLDDVEMVLETFEALHRGAIAQTKVVEDSLARLDNMIAETEDGDVLAKLTRRRDVMAGMLRITIAEQSARGQAAGLLRSHVIAIGRRISSIYPDDANG